MTDSELEKALQDLKRVQQRTNSGIHELLNVLAILKGEIDLAVDRARQAVAEFYAKFPEFRD